MASYPKHINHELSPMACPVGLDAVDLFGDGAQEHWYEAYEILHREAPVLRIEGGGLTPGTDAFVLTKHADVARVVKDPERFPSLTQARVGGYADQGMSPEETLRHLPQLDARRRWCRCARRRSSTSATARSSPTRGSGRGRCATGT